MGHTLHALTYVSLLYPKTAMTRSADLSEEFVRLGMVNGAICKDGLSFGIFFFVSNLLSVKL
jgi:hypothetical protein